MIHPYSFTPPPICQRVLRIAERDPRRAVGPAQRLLATCKGDEPLVRAWVEYTLGWSLLWWERFDAARHSFHTAQEGFHVQDAPFGVYCCQHAILTTELAQRAHPNLEGLFATLAEHFVHYGAPLHGARVWLDQARLLNVLGRPRDAERVLERIAAPIVEHGSLVDRARWLRVRGVTTYLCGDDTQAGVLLDQAEQSFVALRYTLDTAKCRLEQAYVLFRQERLDEALARYQDVEHLFLRLDVPLQRAFCAKNMGALLIMRGSYDVALQATLTALDSFTRVQRTGDIGACHLHVGNIYFRTGHWEAAVAAYVRAETLYNAAGAIGYSLLAQRNRAMAYAAQGKHADARAVLESVESQATGSGNRLEVAEIWSLQAEILAQEGHDEAALQRYQQAQDVFALLHNVPGVADCALEQGWLLLRRGEISYAQTTFQSAQTALHHHPHHRWRVAYGLARCAEHSGDDASALEHYRVASATIAALRRRLVSEIMSSSLYLQAAQLYSDAVRFTAYHAAVESLLEISEEQRGLVLQRMIATRLPALTPAYQVEHDVLVQGISALLDADVHRNDRHAIALDAALTAYAELLLRVRHSTAFEETIANLPADVMFNLPRARDQLTVAYGTDWTALVFIVHDNVLLMVTVTPLGLAVAQTTIDESLHHLLERACQESYRSYTYQDVPFLRGQTTHPWASLAALADRLLPSTVRARLHPLHRLLLVPAGPLHAVPWAALRLETSWLIEQAVVQVVPSLAIWQFVATKSYTPGDGLLLLGCADFGNRAAPLPGVAAESAAIAAACPIQCIEEPSAARNALLDRSASGELETYRVVHIASHAQLLSTRGLAAHVKFRDGDMFLSEVAMLRLNGALVTLSACDGASVDPLPGEEILSLSRAFLAAGASGVLASLWPVYDQAIISLMTLFYAAFWQHGDAALALAYAQRSLIAHYQQNDDPRAEPLCWGSFVLMGASTGVLK